VSSTRLDKLLLLPVRDDEAYYERLAIMQTESDGTGLWMDPFRIANECAKRTYYSRVATAALRGDWYPLWGWCARECRTSDDQSAQDIMLEVRTRVQSELEWRMTLYNR